MSIAFVPARLALKLGAVVVFLATIGSLVALHEAGTLDLPGGGVMVNLFSLNKEGTVPSWFASSLLLMVSVLAYLVSRTDLPHVRRFRSLWILFAVLFLLLSLDETASLHERLQSVLEKRGGAVTEAITFVWVIPALAFCAVLGIAYLRFVLALDAGVRWRLILAGVIYISGAAGMEIIDGAVLTQVGDGVTYRLLTVLEEVLEMSGAVLCISTLCDVLYAGAPALFLVTSPHPAVAPIPS